MKKQTIVVALLSLFLAYILYNQIRVLASYRLYFSHFWFTWRVWLSMADFLFGVAAFVQYLVTKKRSSQLLRIWLFFMLSSCVTGILIDLLHFCLPTQRSWQSPDSLTAYERNIFKDLLFGVPVLAMEYFCFFALNRARTAVLTLDPESTTENYVFHPVDGWTRFGNRLIDVAFVSLLAIQYEPYLQYMLAYTPYGSGFLHLGSFQALNFFLGFCLFFYYLLMESITGISFGKLVTDTVIVNESGLRPHFGQRLGRTFARLVPFDGISFLFRRRGWHDSLSGTYVTKGKYTGE